MPLIYIFLMMAFFCLCLSMVGLITMFLSTGLGRNKMAEKALRFASDSGYCGIGFAAVALFGLLFI